MEWYVGSEADNLVVSRDHESLERISSLDNWPQWDANLARKQELNFNGIKCSRKMNLNDSFQERDDLDYNSSPMCQEGVYNGLPQWLHEDDQARIDRMDDIFINSVLEEDVSDVDNPDILMVQQYSPSTSHSLESSEYPKTYDFLPSMDWGNVEISSTCLVKDSLDSLTGNDSSLEESVLQELERVTLKLTKKRRICYRNALYRLAENSKHPRHLTSDDENSRSGETEVEELIAGLMFSRMNFLQRET